MPIKTLEISTNLKKKGFRENVDSDHKRYTFYYKEKKTPISTKISHSQKEIGNPLINLMAKQVHLKKDEFERFVQCTLSQEKYEELLLNQGLIN